MRPAVFCGPSGPTYGEFKYTPHIHQIKSRRKGLFDLDAIKKMFL
jgi:hypothetical protein